MSDTAKNFVTKKEAQDSAAFLVWFVPIYFIALYFVQFYVDLGQPGWTIFDPTHWWQVAYAIVLRVFLFGFLACCVIEGIVIQAPVLWQYLHSYREETQMNLDDTISELTDLIHKIEIKLYGDIITWTDNRLNQIIEKYAEAPPETPKEYADIVSDTGHIHRVEKYERGVSYELPQAKKSYPKWVFSSKVTM